MVSGLLALLTVVMGPGSGPERAADRYRVDLNMKQAADLSSIGQGMQESSVSATVFMNVAMSDTAGGRIAHVVVDSMRVSGEGALAAQFPQALADSIKGAFIHAYIVNGKPEGAPTYSVEGNPALALATQGLSALFPGVSEKAAGQKSWADTNNTSTVNEAINVTSNQVVTWAVTGQSGTLLTVTGTGQGTVTGEQGGNPVSGTVSNTLTAVTPIGGPSRSADLSSNQDMTVLVAQLPEPIAVKVTSTMKLTPLP
ncbi:MAG TPA: hypothetical protein VFN22_10700 [Gemmatimonadales bacterium]|nr:hypothetical protein [Gemmatimonadales bacterium]